MINYQFSKKFKLLEHDEFNYLINVLTIPPPPQRGIVSVKAEVKRYPLASLKI